MSFRRFLAIMRARNKEFWRDRAALAWNFIFPIMVIGGFAVAFSGDGPDLYKVGITAAQSSQNLHFEEIKYIQFIPVTDLSAAITKVERHQLDMLISPATQQFWINDSSPAGYLLERLLNGSDAGFKREAVTGEGIRYVDWLISGILAMNLMFSALFGVGFVIVRYRKNGMLKRLKATPVTAFEFISAQVVSRLWLLLSVSALVFFLTDLVLDFRMYGSYFDLLIVFALGAICLISLGLLIAARLASEELAGGLLNAISWPMMFLSGVWFSLEGVNPWLVKLAQILPLTHVIDGARAIMIDGAGLMDIWPNLMALMVMTAVFLLIAARTFRWE
ncbi:MAG: ABC transporter permease [Candidatus Polarisedimenticolaceae bacterium]|nr:ABC transporter permease [Candidatus Polarisedimenticolaceae bacterium]